MITPPCFALIVFVMAVSYTLFRIGQQEDGPEADDTPLNEWVRHQVQPRQRPLVGEVVRHHDPPKRRIMLNGSQPVDVEMLVNGLDLFNTRR